MCLIGSVLHLHIPCCSAMPDVPEVSTVPQKSQCPCPLCRPTACARLQPSFPSTTNATLSYTAIVESSVPLEASSMPGTLACNTSQLGAYLLVQFSLPTPSPSPPMPSPPLPSPPTPSTPESPLETDPDGLPTIRLNANVSVPSVCSCLLGLCLPACPLSFPHCPGNFRYRCMFSP